MKWFWNMNILGWLLCGTGYFCQYFLADYGFSQYDCSRMAMLFFLWAAMTFLWSLFGWMNK